MNRNIFARLALLIGALAVLFVLQGCGGDDNGGVDQSLHDQTMMDLQGMLDAANNKVKELEGQIGADADELATAKADAAKYKKMVDDASEMDDAEEMRAYMVNRAKSIMAAMSDRTDPAPAVEVEWDDDANAADISVTDDYAAGDAPPAIDGWTDATLTQARAMPVGGTDSVYIYTDVHAPEAKKLRTCTSSPQITQMSAIPLQPPWAWVRRPPTPVCPRWPCLTSSRRPTTPRPHLSTATAPAAPTTAWLAISTAPVPIARSCLPRTPTATSC